MIELYTAATPNGWKASIALEELGLAYRVHALDLLAGDQKRPEFLRINPNGRIPAIVDPDADDVPIFESGAILIYLAEKAGRLLPTGPAPRARVLSWLMFQMGGIGPMMGQANVFLRYFPEKIQPAIDRFQGEVRRLFGVLNGALADARYLANDDYSIADIANWAWARTYFWSGVTIEAFPNLARWLEDIESRPAVQRGVAVPSRDNFDMTTGRGRDGAEFARAARSIIQTGTTA